VPIVSNKNWNSGGNAGITIGLWNGCEVRFNLGGSGRIDNSGNAVSDGQWAYLALAVDRTAGTFTSYVFDPVKGTQKQSTAFPQRWARRSRAWATASRSPRTAPAGTSPPKTPQVRHAAPWISTTSPCGAVCSPRTS